MSNFNGLKTIDWQLSLTLANNRADTATELFNMFIDELPQAQQDINDAYTAQNFEKLQQYVHKLHGATCYCGVPRLKEIVKTLEGKLKSPQKNHIDELLFTLNEEIGAVLAAFANKQFQ